MTEYILAITMFSVAIMVIFLIKDLKKKTQKH
jgi:hypothetical protein